MDQETMRKLAEPYVKAREEANAKLSPELKRVKAVLEGKAQQIWWNHSTAERFFSAVPLELRGEIEKLTAEEAALIRGCFAAEYSSVAAGLRYHGNTACAGRNSAWEIPSAILKALEAK